MVGFGGLVARFRELKEDERFRRELRDAVEWLWVFLIMVVWLWILK
jgi:hypothetical protein